MLFGKKKKARAVTASSPAEDTRAEHTAAQEGAAAAGPAAGTGAAGAADRSPGDSPGAGQGSPAGASSDAEAGSGSRPGSRIDAGLNAETATEEAVAAVATPSADAPAGTPRDIAELSGTKGFLDFGGLMIPASPQQKVRLDIDQKTKRVVALTITLGQASIQLQPFSAPKSGGTWDEVREQIADSVKAQKGRIKEVDGRFGKELAARVPTVLKDGRQGWRVARFIGFEGPRWFLRGVVGGRGAIDAEAAREVEDFFASVVVVRGEDPLPPRELLPLRPPEGAKRVAVPRNPAQRRDAGNGPNPGAAALDANAEGQS